MSTRPIALITGVSRAIGIGAAIANKLAESGWDLALTFWRPYDALMTWGSTPGDTADIVARVQSHGARVAIIEANLELAETPAHVFDAVERELGPVTALILNHCHDVESDILSTTVEEFDRHFAINARAGWLLIREFARRFQGPHGSGRILAITSDHTAGNMPYGASKGALDRIVLAAAREFRDRGITANVINPGATDTGWMTDALKAEIQAMTLLGRIGMPEDVANLVAFLCSKQGGWINAQLLYSNGGL